MTAWSWGLMSYPYLLPSQLLIIEFYCKAYLDFTRGEGFFDRSCPVFGRSMLVVGYLYFGAMIVRYIDRMSFSPEGRWFGGMVPIVFHWVLASVIMAFGQCHRDRLTHSSQPS